MKKPKNHKDGSMYVIESGDHVLLGGVAKGFFGCDEPAVLITFSSAPGTINDVAVAIPERAWEALAAWFASGKRGKVVIP